MTKQSQNTLSERLRKLDWELICADLNTHGSSAIGPILTPNECVRIAKRYDNDNEFRNRIVMSRHGFGS